MDNELLLYDRLEAIRIANKKYDLEHTSYLSFSGGKDSTILHYMLDMALPNNRIPRVYINTGIEYLYIYQFVKELSKSDDRIIIVNSNINIKSMLDKYGYPFKSKEHSLRVEQFNKGKNSNYIKKYISGYGFNGKPSSFVCPKILLYQFKEKGKYNYSNLCCYKLKKNPIKKWQKLNNRSIAITGMRSEEGGNRRRLNCIITSKSKVIRFHPLIKVNEDFENWFIDKFNIKLCKLYYPPYNFVRTGCKGCPYSLSLSKDLDTMAQLLPNERKQCEIIWKPVYDEYRRIGYRLESNMNIYDYLIEKK